MSYNNDFEYKAEMLVKQRGGIGALAKAAIRDGMTNDEVVEVVRRRFPAASTTLRCANWYRQALLRMGEEVPRDRDLSGMRRALGIAAE